MFDTRLEDQYRGSKFKYFFVLGNAWLDSIFDDLKWTLRTKLPDTNIRSDANAVFQASVSRGTITFDEEDGSLGQILIPARITTNWPTGLLFWDMKGLVEGDWEIVDSGTIKIVHDNTRSI